MLTIEWFTERIGRRTSEVSPCAYGRWLDGVLVTAEAGHLVIDYVVRPEMTNPAGILHGGVVAGMIDDVFGMLAATLVEERFLVTIDLHVDQRGRPYAAFSVRDATGHHYAYARHDGSRWHVHHLAHASRALLRLSFSALTVTLGALSPAMRASRSSTS